MANKTHDEDVNFIKRCLAGSKRVQFVDPFNHVSKRQPSASQHSWKFDELMLPVADDMHWLIGNGSSLHVADV